MPPTPWAPCRAFLEEVFEQLPHAVRRRLDTLDVRFRHFRHHPDRPSSLSNDTVYALHVDSAGVLWAGTHVGLNCLDPTLGGSAFRHWFARNGLASDVVYGIRSDADHRLWITTANGLSRLDPESGNCKSYDVSHGLQANEFNFGAHYRSRAGELFFGGVNGFNAFHPDRIEGNTAVPAVVMTGLTLFNQPLAFDRPLFDVGELEFRYDDHFLAFEFAALGFTAPERNRYRYRLEGLEEAWIELGTERRVTFASLTPGDYTLRVQGSNNDGVWNERGLALPLRITPPFWQTWWFRVLITAAVLAAAFRRLSRPYPPDPPTQRAPAGAGQAAYPGARRGPRRAAQEGAAGDRRRARPRDPHPLSIMQNTLYLLGRLLADDRARKMFGRIEEQIRRTDRIVRKLLDYTRGSNPDRQPFVLQEIAAQALEELEIPPSVRTGQRFEGDPITVTADPLPGPAHPHQPAQQRAPGDAGRRRAAHRVRAGRRPGGGVGDRHRGVGIAAEELPKIFELLFTTKADGIGLGLTVSQRYARLNQGRIECDNLTAGGAIFRRLLHLVQDLPAADADPGAGEQKE